MQRRKLLRHGLRFLQYSMDYTRYVWVICRVILLVSANALKQPLELGYVRLGRNFLKILKIFPFLETLSFFLQPSSEPKKT